MCSFPNVVVFRIECYLSFYLLKPVVFHKGYFVTVPHATRSGFFAFRRDFKNSIWSCVVAIGKYYEMSFVFFHTLGWIYSPCGNLKLSIDVLEPIWYISANFLVFGSEIRESELCESDLECRVKVWSQGFQSILPKLKHLNMMPGVHVAFDLKTIVRSAINCSPVCKSTYI